MIDKTTIEKINSLIADEVFVTKFKKMEEYDEVKKLFLDNGVELTDEDFVKIFEAALKHIENENSSELSEEQMENVSGGFVEWIVLGAVGATVAGVATYKARKWYNSAMGMCR